MGKEYEFAGTGILILTFSSRVGQSFHLAVRDLGIWKGTTETTVVNTVEYSWIKRELSDYPDSLHMLKNPNEGLNARRHWFVHFQGHPGYTINVAIENTVVTPPNELKMYRFSLSQRQFELYGRYQNIKQLGH